MGKPSLDEDRRADLRRYLIKCVSQHLISWGDLRRPLVVLTKLGSTMLSDIAAVGRGARDELGEVALETAGGAFMALADRLSKAKR